MTTVLVSGASGVVGYGILRSLRQSADKLRLIGTTIYSDSIAPAFCDVFELAPMTIDHGYIHWLCGIIKKYEVNLIIPGIEADVSKWSNEREVLQEMGAKILTNNAKLIALCNDKWLFYEKLKESNPVLAIDTRIKGSFSEFAHDFGLPFLLKPRCSFASKGIVKVETKEVYRKHEDKLGSVLMAQPIVGNSEEEYTTSAFFDGQSELCCCMTLRRKLSKEGFTEKAQVAEIDGIDEILKNLASIFRPVGPTNFQFRKHEGKLKLLEVNPRISSATSIRTAFGYNESAMSVEFYLGGKLPAQPVVKRGVAIRYMEDHMFYDRESFCE